MNSYEFLWIPMDSWGFLWIPIDSHGFHLKGALWIPKDSYGFQVGPFKGSLKTWDPLDLSPVACDVEPTPGLLSEPVATGSETTSCA